MLVGVLGSSYAYSNLFVSQNDFEMMSEFGEKTLAFPPGYVGISSEKYLVKYGKIVELED